MFKTKFLLVGLFAFFAISCGPSQEVSRVESDKQVDLSGKWNDTDARKVAETMTSTILSAPWITNQEMKEDPVLIVGNINNNTAEHIRTDIFIKEIERFLVNSQKVEMVADSEQREQIRKERLDSHKYAENPTALAKELGADYMLVGNIDANVQKNMDGTRVAKYYTVNLELINVKNNRKAWIGNEEIKKLISRDKVKW